MAERKGDNPPERKEDRPKDPKETQQATETGPGHREFVSQAHVEDVLGEKPPTGYCTTLMHLTKGYVGTGIFAMGEGFKNSGMLFGPVLLFIIAIINLNCQHILIKTAVKIASEEEQEVKPSFAETVEYTMAGSKLKCLKNNAKALGRLTNIFLCCCELGFCCVYFVFIADHLVEVADNHDWLDADKPASKHIMLAIILGPMWASTFLSNLKLLLPLSIIANILIWTGIGIIFYFTTYEALPLITDRPTFASVERWPLYFGTVLYAFEGITFIIPLRNEMRYPSKFVSILGVLNVGMTFVSTLYFLVGFLGYWKYGDEVKSSVFLNLVEEDAKMSDVTNCIMSVAILFTFTLHMYIPFEILFPLFYRKYGPFKHGIIVMCTFRSGLVLLTYFLANVIPFLGLFISLVGATGGAFLALIIPSMLELVAFQGELKIWMIIKDIIVISIGIFGSITGTIMSLLDIIKKFRETY